MLASFVYLSPFVADAKHLRLTDDDLRAMESVLLAHPEAGAVIAGTGGMRKIRFARPSGGAGKSGGVRVCYAYFVIQGWIVLYAVYGKSEKANLTPAERNECKRVLNFLREQFTQDRR